MLYYLVVVLYVLVCVFLMFCWLWPNNAASSHQPIVPTQPSRCQRSKEPKPFAGLSQRPPCALCEHEAAQPHVAAAVGDDDVSGMSAPAWQRREGRPGWGRSGSRADSLEVPTFLRRQMD